MTHDWMSRLDEGSIPVAGIKKHLSSLRYEDQELLDMLMKRITDECSLLEILPARGFAPFSFHIKTPGTDRPCVMAAVHPQKRNGIRVMSRRSLSGYVPKTDPQLKWQAQIKTSEDIDIVMRYLRGV